MTHAVEVCSSRKQWSHVNHSQQACSSQELRQALRPEEEIPSSLQGGVPGKLLNITVFHVSNFTEDINF